MTYKTIVAIIQNQDDLDRVLACALPLARRFDAHVIGVHAGTIPMAYASSVGFPDVEYIRVSIEANKERALALEGAFKAKLAEAGQPGEWRAFESFSGNGGHSGAVVARAADLVVVAQRDPEAASDDAADADALLYEAGRPVLVVPFAGAITTTFRRILVPWNGSREAARAVFDALPFILEAAETRIIAVDPPESEHQPDASAADIAAALSRHGANVSLTSEPSDGRSVDDIIQDRVEETGADLLVMGAYSHSWLRELLFGGVTRSVLQESSVPTFMSR